MRNILIVINDLKSEIGNFSIQDIQHIQNAVNKHRDEEFKLLIHSGPGHYTTSRKGIAIGLAYKKILNCPLTTFCMLKDFLSLFGDSCFYKEKNMIWVYEKNKEIRMQNINDANIDSNFVGNVNINNNTIIDCSIDNIWKYKDTLFKNTDNHIQPKYYDKFTIDVQK